MDDIFGVFRGNTSEFKEFIDRTNNIYPEILLNFNTNSNQIEFLDVTIYKYIKYTPYLDVNINVNSIEEIKMGHRLYIKPGNTITVIDKSSFIKASTKEAVIYNQL